MLQRKMQNFLRVLRPAIGSLPWQWQWRAAVVHQPCDNSMPASASGSGLPFKRRLLLVGRGSGRRSS